MEASWLSISEHTGWHRSSLAAMTAVPKRAPWADEVDEIPPFALEVAALVEVFLATFSCVLSVVLQVACLKSSHKYVCILFGPSFTKSKKRCAIAVWAPGAMAPTDNAGPRICEARGVVVRDRNRPRSPNFRLTAMGQYVSGVDGVKAQI